ncbi:hypothetical protein CEXT_807491 [Caerostris extrusa]|uniref:Uncharacterized protein n=1 Tax=Caerostris extrusa TaxID=172846 RepID=A0AAV4T2F9_CAEEX|nr:hypothetical protein CEXT_807491 [Caerostris extrusa]
MVSTGHFPTIECPNEIYRQPPADHPCTANPYSGHDGGSSTPSIPLFNNRLLREYILAGPFDMSLSLVI